MLFNSYEFLLFLPVVFALYWGVFRGRRTQNAFVVIASYVFYGAWDWRFLFLIFLTSITSWASGLYIEANRGIRRRMRIAVAANMLLNLGILFYFKYFNFFVDNLRVLFGQFGYQLDWVTLEVLLPVGISFYTFQAVSYSIDVYRGKIEATRDIVAFLAFVSFFPQLVAGPIERSTQLLPQFLRRRHFDYGQAVSGMQLILWGFFKKIVIADNCAFLVNSVYGNIGECEGSSLLLAGVLFTFQIYGDFSGYSDIARGVGRLFGISLMQNFHYPFLSRSVGELWRRWHISLNRWFIDYVFIPLGGSHKGKARTCANVMIVFFLSGLWHGADWTFVLWGLFFGVLVSAGVLIGVKKEATPVVANDTVLPSPRETLGLILTYLSFLIGVIVFRSDSVGMAFDIFSGICGSTLFSTPSFLLSQGRMLVAYTFTFIIMLMVWEYIKRRRQYPLEGIGNRAVRWALYLLLTMTIVVFAAPQETFIYFQF